MKLFLLLFWMLGMTCNCFVKGAQTDPVKKAKQANEQKADRGMVDKAAADFLVASADARMMDMQEGQLAAKNGTTTAIRRYGQLMVKDQALLLKKIKKLAADKRIDLPPAISNKKRDGREDLAEQSGKDFDKKFIKMMKIDHERDVKLFKKAADSDDAAISAFAGKYLPMIQGHLDKINGIRATTK